MLALGGDLRLTPESKSPSLRRSEGLSCQRPSASLRTYSRASASSHGGSPAAAFSPMRSGRLVAGMALCTRSSLRIHFSSACPQVATPNRPSGSSAAGGGGDG